MTARLQQLLQECANGNQSELARMSGLTSPDINRYMSGQHLPRVEHLVALAQSCGVSVDWILGMPGAVNGLSSRKPDEKIGIPPRAIAVVDFEAVRRFVAGDPLAERDIAALRFVDHHVRLVDAAEFATVQRQLDDAAKAKSRKQRRSRPAE